MGKVAPLIVDVVGSDKFLVERVKLALDFRANKPLRFWIIVKTGMIFFTTHLNKILSPINHDSHILDKTHTNIKFLMLMMISYPKRAGEN